MMDLMRKRVQRVWKSEKKIHLKIKEVHLEKKETL
jgi:hypothetical protein